MANMIPPQCDSPCQVRRLRMYIIYIVILVICVVLALFHFIVNLIGRRKVKEEARDYFARRQSAISYYSLEQLYPNPVYQSVQDNITITTDGSTALRIEMPEESGGVSPSGGHRLNGGSSASFQRPLQKIPEELGESYGGGVASNGVHPVGLKMSTVAVDVHAEDEQNPENKKGRRPSVVSNHNHSKSLFTFSRGGRTSSVAPADNLGCVKGMITNGPVSVAVATVSAVVAQTQTTYQFDSNALNSDGGFSLGNISRPTSASSCFDISDIVESPEMPRKKIVSKSKTC